MVLTGEHKGGSRWLRSSRGGGARGRRRRRSRRCRGSRFQLVHVVEGVDVDEARGRGGWARGAQWAHGCRRPWRCRFGQGLRGRKRHRGGGKRRARVCQRVEGDHIDRRGAMDARRVDDPSMDARATASTPLMNRG